MCELSAGAAGGGSSLVLVHRHLTMVAPAIVEQSPGVRASAVVACRLSCSTACGIFPDQGLNQCPLPCEADSSLLWKRGLGISLVCVLFVVW